MSLKHKHLIIAFDSRWPPKDSEEAKHFLSFLIKRIDMAIASSPEIAQNPMGYYCELAGNEGVTAVGILETSHCAIHSWNLDSPAKFQFDLYSCKEFDVPYIISLCNAFGILKGSYLVIDRDSELKVIEIGKLKENGVIE